MMDTEWVLPNEGRTPQGGVRKGRRGMQRLVRYHEGYVLGEDLLAIHLGWSAGCNFLQERNRKDVHARNAGLGRVLGL